MSLIGHMVKPNKQDESKGTFTGGESLMNKHQYLHMQDDDGDNDSVRSMTDQDALTEPEIAVDMLVKMYANKIAVKQTVEAWNVELNQKAPRFEVKDVLGYCDKFHSAGMAAASNHDGSHEYGEEHGLLREAFLEVMAKQKKRPDAEEILGGNYAQTYLLKQWVQGQAQEGEGDWSKYILNFMVKGHNFRMDINNFNTHLEGLIKELKEEVEKNKASTSHVRFLAKGIQELAALKLNNDNPPLKQTVKIYFATKVKIDTLSPRQKEAVLKGFPSFSSIVENSLDKVVPIAARRAKENNIPSADQDCVGYIDNLCLINSMKEQVQALQLGSTEAQHMKDESLAQLNRLNKKMLDDPNVDNATQITSLGEGIRQIIETESSYWDTRKQLNQDFFNIVFDDQTRIYKSAGFNGCQSLVRQFEDRDLNDKEIQVLMILLNPLSHETELDPMSVDHLRQTQKLFAEINKTEDLKDNIAAIGLMYGLARSSHSKGKCAQSLLEEIAAGKKFTDAALRVLPELEKRKDMHDPISRCFRRLLHWLLKSFDRNYHETVKDPHNHTRSALIVKAAVIDKRIHHDAENESRTKSSQQIMAS